MFHQHFFVEKGVISKKVKKTARGRFVYHEAELGLVWGTGEDSAGMDALGRIPVRKAITARMAIQIK